MSDWKLCCDGFVLEPVVKTRISCYDIKSFIFIVVELALMAD